MDINYQIPLLIENSVLLPQDKIIHQLTCFIPNLFYITTCSEDDFVKKSKLYLRLDRQGLAIICLPFSPFYIKDIYTKINPRVLNIKNELLYKAIKLNNYTPKSPILAYDLTAGFARDALILAAYATKVLIFESNPLLASLLNYAIYDNLLPDNIDLIYGDCSYFLNQKIECPPDIIYFDPMFSDKKSAKSKKDLQIIQQIHAQYPTPNTLRLSDEEILALAWYKTKNKVVVKRDNNGKAIAINVSSSISKRLIKEPDFSKSGSSVRYDIYHSSK